MKLGVLASGNGSNLQAILDAIARGELPARVQLVIANEPSAKALTRAQAAGVPTLCIPHRDFPSRQAFDQRLAEALSAANVEWVVLAGFMRLLSPEFLARFPRRVLNIHPALLPAFPGLNAVRQALEHGVKVSGCTVHLVDSGVDNGAIIGQAAVPVIEGDSEESLAQRIHAAEHQLYVRTLTQLAHCDLQLSKGAGGREVATLRPK